MKAKSNAKVAKAAKAAAKGAKAKVSKPARVTNSHKPRVLMTEGSFMESLIARFRIMEAEVEIASSDHKTLAKQYARATHILIPGGADIHPKFYNESVVNALPGNMERDIIESALVRTALSEGKPLMGICRGHQMITVVAGGSLYQDLGIEFDEETRSHRGERHDIETRNHTKLAKILGRWVPAVASYHHQAVKRVPKGWHVAAVSEDGVIEAIEHPRLPVISVQWHPEAMYGATSSVRLFEAFLYGIKSRK